MPYSAAHAIDPKILDPETLARLRETAFRETIRANPREDPYEITQMAQHYYCSMMGQDTDTLVELVGEMAEAIESLKSANDRASKWGLATLSQSDIDRLEAVLVKARNMGNVR